MPWFCLTTGWRKRTVCLVDYIIPLDNVFVNSSEMLTHYLFYDAKRDYIQIPCLRATLFGGSVRYLSFIIDI